MNASQPDRERLQRSTARMGTGWQDEEDERWSYRDTGRDELRTKSIRVYLRPSRAERHKEEERKSNTWAEVTTAGETNQLLELLLLKIRPTLEQRIQGYLHYLPVNERRRNNRSEAMGPHHTLWWRVEAALQYLNVDSTDLIRPVPVGRNQGKFYSYLVGGGNVFKQIILTLPVQTHTRED